MTKSMHFVLRRLHTERMDNYHSDFRPFGRQFMQAFRAFLKRELLADELHMKLGWFEISGFFHTESGWWYFITPEVRFGNRRMLVRNCKGTHDYEGGVNRFISLEGTDTTFKRRIKNIVIKGSLK